VPSTSKAAASNEAARGISYGAVVFADVAAAAERDQASVLLSLQRRICRCDIGQGEREREGERKRERQRSVSEAARKRRSRNRSLSLLLIVAEVVILRRDRERRRERKNERVRVRVREKARERFVRSCHSPPPSPSCDRDEGTKIVNFVVVLNGCGSRSRISLS
jgi:hypothetical protein